MDNKERIAIYTRDRSTLTPAQKRRVRHRQNAATAPIGRRTLRRAHTDVKRTARLRRGSIRAAFAAMRGRR